MRVRIKFRHWLLRRFMRRTRGMVIYPWILFRDAPEQITYTLVRHEFQHVRQVREDGWLNFYLRYLWRHLKWGYRRNPYEVEAFAMQEDPLRQDELEAYATAKVRYWSAEDWRLH